jgi:ATP-dependent Clp protease ATP-binding subunit ClpC
VVVLAQEEARGLSHNYIGTEHILLGMLREEEGIAAGALAALDITVERVRAQITRIVGSGDEVTSGPIPFTPRAKRVLELALREALSLGHNYIGTEHILLGLVRENEGVAARVLLDFDADDEKVRLQVLSLISDPSGPADPGGPSVISRRQSGPDPWLQVGISDDVRRLLRAPRHGRWMKIGQRSRSATSCSSSPAR